MPDTTPGSAGGAVTRFRLRWSSRRTAPAPAAEIGPAYTAEPALWRLRTTVEDAPGSLGAVCTALARAAVDIVSLQTHPLADGAVDEFLLRAPGGLAAADLARAVDAAGGSRTWLERADAHDLVDPPTRMLALAARTALSPAELPLALRQLLGRCTVTADPLAAPGPAALEPAVLRLPDPAGGVLTVRRDHLPFTPTEFARARALVEVAARLGAPRPPAPRTAPGVQGRLTVRPAGRRDRAPALALHARCSPGTLARRYHGPAADADRYLEHLLDPRFGRSLAAESADGRLVALGHLLWDDAESEVALLVEDAWQRRGVGSLLLRALLELAAEEGRGSVYGVTGAADGSALAGLLRATGLPCEYQVEGATLVATLALPPSAALLPWAPARQP
jgi:GNAT superfamily N-acetyltransferase